MIQRKAYDALERPAKQFPVVAITGSRQSGKTLLAKGGFSGGAGKEIRSIEPCGMNERRR